MSETNGFESGRIVYDRSGLKYEFVEALSNGGALARQIFTADDYDGLTEWPADVASVLSLATLSLKPPIAAISAEVAAEIARLEAVRLEVREAQQALREQERESLQRIETLKRHPKLARIEDFLAGRITHFIETGDYYKLVKVHTFEGFARGVEDGRPARDLKLLTLFGRSNGDLVWRINTYYDGSGSWRECLPFTSLEEAEEAARAVIAKFWEGYRLNEEASARDLGKAVAAASDLSVEVPEDIKAAWKEALLKGARANAERTETEAAAARAKLAEVEALS